MKGKWLKKVISVVIALAILTSLASVSFAEGRKEKSSGTSIVVSFNMGHYTKRVEVESGEPVMKPDRAPEKEGYAFSYWYLKDDQYQTPYDFSLPVTTKLKLEPFYLLAAPVVGENNDTNQDAETQEHKDDKDEEMTQEAPVPGDTSDSADPSENNKPEPDSDSDNDDAKGFDPVDTNTESKESDQDDSISNDDDSDDANHLQTEDNAIDDDQEIDNIMRDDANNDEPDELTDNPEIDYDMETEEEDEEQGDSSQDENDLLPKYSIRIWTDAPEQVEEGYLVTLHSELIGYEDCRIALCWQYSTDGGMSWQNAENGSAYTYTYEACEELSNCLWHLVVTVLEDMSVKQ